MKKINLLICLFFITAPVFPQDYLINFAGTGGSATVDSVIVENLSQGTSLKMEGSDILNLRAYLTGLSDIYDNSEKELKVYPNPSAQNATIEFDATSPGNACISVYNQVGQKIIQTQTNLAKGIYTYQIHGLSSGTYILQVTSDAYTYTGEIISLQKSNTKPGISFTGFVDGSDTQGRLKSSTSTIEMQYNSGDTLKLTGISAIYRTIATDVITGSKTVTFNFIACTDALSNNYSTVKIGDQTWMAENLRTTEYKDGSPIPWATDTTWESPGYTSYTVNQLSYEATYGYLYNWFTVNTGNLCPTGWRVPSDFEWTSLEVFLGGQGVRAGGKLKETDTQHWVSPNFAATNETGFTALPGGCYDGNYRAMGYAGYWWSSTEIPGGSYAYYRALYNESGEFIKIYYMNRSSYFSIRCIKE